MTRAWALLAVVTAAYCGAPAPPAASGAGVGPARSAEEVAATLESYLARAEAAGFSGALLVAVRGQVVFARGAGWADEPAGRPNRTDTRFLVASITKTLTAAALARLKARGRLDWSDSIARHLPDVPEDKRDITIAHLLGHRSGLPDTYQGEEAADRAAAERAILAVPLVSPPGTAWRYCNDGYALLAAIIERLTGESYQAYVRRELLDPAGMTATAFRWESAQPGGAIARGHNGELVTDPLSIRRGWGQRGAGGLVTTIGDLHRWARALDAGTAVPRAIQDEMVAEPLPVRPGLADGMGWFVVTTPRGTRALYHGGNDSPAGFTAELRRYVDEDVITVMTANVMEDDVGLNRMVSDCIEAIVFGGRCDWPPPVAARPIDRALAGVYLLPTGGRLRVEADVALRIGADGQDAVDLLRPVPAERRTALLRASARVAAGEVPGVPGTWRLVGTAPVSTDLATTTVESPQGERARVLWYGEQLGGVLQDGRWAAPARLIPQPDGGFVAWAPLLGTGVRIRVDAAGALIVSHRGGSVTAARGR